MSFKNGFHYEYLNYLNIVIRMMEFSNNTNLICRQLVSEFLAPEPRMNDKRFYQSNFPGCKILQHIYISIINQGRICDFKKSQLLKVKVYFILF